MKLRVEDKRRAIALRQAGHTYSEIRKEIIDLPKGTLAGWMKNIELSDHALKRMSKKMRDGIDRGRFQAILANRAKRLQREIKVAAAARKEFRQFKSEPLFFTGIALYLAEGTKNGGMFQFINSNPALIQIISRWLERFIRYPEKGMARPPLYPSSLRA